MNNAAIAVAVGKIELDETQATGFSKLGASRFFQRRIIVGVHVVETDHVAAVPQQTLRNMKADEPGGACYENGPSAIDPILRCL